MRSPAALVLLLSAAAVRGAIYPFSGILPADGDLALGMDTAVAAAAGEAVAAVDSEAEIGFNGDTDIESTTNPGGKNARFWQFHEFMYSDASAPFGLHMFKAHVVVKGFVSLSAKTAGSLSGLRMPKLVMIRFDEFASKVDLSTPLCTFQNGKGAGGEGRRERGGLGRGAKGTERDDWGRGERARIRCIV